MKKMTIAFVMMCLLFSFAVPAAAKDQTAPLTLQWEYDAADLPYITGWVLYWSEVSGSGYVRAAEIPITSTPAAGDTYTSTTPLVIAGAPGTTVGKYFVLTAKGQNNGYESAFSNEVAKSWVIPLSAPFNLIIPVTVR